MRSSRFDRALGRTLEHARRAVTSAAASLDRNVVRFTEDRLQRARLTRSRAAASAGPSRAAEGRSRERVLELARVYGGGTLALPSPFFPTPEPAPLALVAAGSGPLDSRVYELTQPSSYQPFWAQARDPYLTFRENLTSHARWWHSPRPRRGDGRAVIVTVHGWGAGAHWMTERVFEVSYWLHHGFDVVAFQLPFHGLRTPAGRASGALFPSGDLARTNEAFGHAVYDLRALATALRRHHDVTTLGALGMSLGSYVTALWASVADELDFAVATIPAVSMPSLMLREQAGSALGQRARNDGIDEALLHEAFAVHAPLSRPVRLPPERLFVIAGDGDRVTPAAQAQALIDHWGCANHWFAGGHLAQVGRHQALRAARLQLRRAGIGGRGGGPGGLGGE